MSQKKTFRELKEMSKFQLKGKRLILIAAYILINIISGIGQLPLQIISPIMQHTEFAPIMVIIYIIAYLFTLAITFLIFLISVGHIKMYLDLVIGKEPDIESLLYGFKNKPWRTILTFVLMSLIVILIAAPFLAISTGAAVYFIISAESTTTALAIIAGIIMIVGFIGYVVVITILSLAFSQIIYLLVDLPNYSAIQILKLSNKIMKGNKWRLIGLQLSFIGHFLLGLITCGLYFFYFLPYYNTTMANFYMSIMNENNQQNIN